MPASPPPPAPAAPLAKALRAQALGALRELLGGFEEANRAAQGKLLPADGTLYPALVTALLRMVCALFAEARGLLPAGPSTRAAPAPLSRLHAELREDLRRHGRALDARRGAWAGVVALFRALHEGSPHTDGRPLPARGGTLFDPDAYPFLEGRRRARPTEAAEIPAVSDTAVLRALDRLLVLDGEPLSYGHLPVELIGSVHEGLVGFEIRTDRSGSLVLQPGEERRRSGAHYTSPALARVVVERALAPLLHDAAAPGDILALRICDPAMGSGAFLLEACRTLAARLVRAWERTSSIPPLPRGVDPLLHAKRLVARSCLYGVDRSPLAADLARMSLWLETAARDEPLTFLDHRLRQGDSLLGLTREQPGALPAPPLSPGGPRGADERLRRARTTADLAVAALLDPGRRPTQRTAAEVRSRLAPFHWPLELPEVFGGRGGFDAILGNPPWVSYAGRAAQPLPRELRAYYLATSAAFAGYRNLQSLFVERAAALLRPGGRLGLVLPTSMSDLAGYEPSRRAHDALCACDAELPDFGDVFDDVFQPSMALLSTRRPARLAIERTGPWPLERRDLDAAAAALLGRLSALPTLPARLFGERGLQTTGDDVRKLRELPGPEGRFTTPLREGGDIRSFLRLPPRLCCDPSELRSRLRPPEDWRAVKLLIRQTARVPIVALSDGAAFRNSLLAGFEDEAHSASFLLAYLSSSPIRWFHYFRNRDARQGMPQMKIGHLRSFPDLPPGAPGREAIERMGAELGARNSGVSPEEQARLDALVATALGLDGAERAQVATWARGMEG